MYNLTASHLVRLIKSAFPKLPDDRHLGILVDIPGDLVKDNKEWELRRQLAQQWYILLLGKFADVNLHDIHLIVYHAVGSNNAELPKNAFLCVGDIPVSEKILLQECSQISFNDVFKKIQIFLAMTEYSITAPLKKAARIHGFRAASMPGFSKEMIGALNIDFNVIHNRVNLIKEKLDRSISSEVIFLVDGKKEYRMVFDLRFRKGHSSSGQFSDEGTAGNLPSGEAYIVPYEGEKGEISRTEGNLPVQIEDEVVVFSVKENKAFSVEGTGKAALAEKDHLKNEPAYGNMAELGFGILGDFGLNPIGKILLDEKLGFHIAFGRSDHFGGITGPDKFSSPSKVIHLDRIYIPTTQPRIEIASLSLQYEDIESEIIMEKGNYKIF